MALASGGEATCFFCEGQTATDECAHCGRFVCDRCKADWAGSVTCLTCIHAMRELKGDDRFVSGRLVYDNLALLMVVAPALSIPVYGLFFSAMLAPFSLFLALRHWKSPRGIVPRGRARLVWALLVSGGFLAATAAGVVALIVLVPWGG
jgi:hypothetical protein